MNKHVIYLLVRNDPFGLGELTGMLHRQGRTDFDMVGLVQGIPDGKLKNLLDHRLPNQITVDETSLARVITDDIARRAPTTVTILDTAFLPSNPLWFERLIEPLERGEASVTLSRVVHDIYTNWLVQNDFIALQHQAKEAAPDRLLYAFGAVAFTPATLSTHPLLGGGFDDLLLRWGTTEPGPSMLASDALLTHLNPITPAALIRAHRRYARLTRSAGGRLGYAFSHLVEGVARDISFALSRQRPQWMFYSCYFRLRQAYGIARPSWG